MIEPIMPDDIPTQTSHRFPDKVIAAFNASIAYHFIDGEATFTRREVVDDMTRRGLRKEDIFTNNYLDIESIYERTNKWKVYYEKPGPGESFEPYFIFKRA